MIFSFGSNDTEKVWQGDQVMGLPIEIQETTRRKHRMIHNSLNITALRVSFANRLENLSGKNKEFYSIRINHQW